MDNQRNLILAIALSLAVLFAWQIFVAGPQLDQAQQQQTAQQATQSAAGTSSSPSSPSAAGQPAAGTTPAAAAPTLTRDAALAQSPRIKIATPALTGSINLTGGRIDDLRLAEYRQTTEPNSPTVVLLSPNGGPDAYFADFGWATPPGAPGTGPLPGRDTLWMAPAGATLTQTTPVKLTYDNGAGLQFTRNIAVDDKYMFTVTDEVKNSTAMPVTMTPVGGITRVGEPTNSGGSWILHVGPIGVTDKLEMIGYGDIKKDREKVWTGVNNGWVGFTDKYWAATLIPDKSQPFTGRFGYVNNGADVFNADYTDTPVMVAPGETGGATTHLFAGAKQVSVVDGYTEKYGINLFDHLIDWGWLWFFTKPFFYVIDWFYHLFGNFGLAILAVTVLVKAAFFPLANRSYRSMAAMRKIQPQLADLKERYKDDKVKQQQAMMEMYKKEKVNPLAGCWPVALQIPVFFALYSVLFVTIEMRQAPFFGWIQDLAAPDPSTVFNLFGLLPFSPAAVPIIGSFIAIGIWPLLMGVTMFVQMKLNPTPTTDPTQQMIFTYMPVLFTFMLAGFPAGLVIYWAWNNLLSIIQQYVIMRRHGTKVDLLANIRAGFMRPKPALATPAPAAAAVSVPKAANDPGAPPAKSGKTKTKKPPRPAGASG